MRLDSVRTSRRSIISLTPLIDVVFILLLFFMLTSRFQHYQAMALKVPAADFSATSQTDVEPVVLELTSDGRVSINGALPIDQSELKDSLTMKEAITDELPVYVGTGAKVTLSTLTKFMDQLSASGLTTVSLRGVR